MRHATLRTGRLLVAAGLISLLAACNASRGQYASLGDYTPDPALKSASKSNLKSRVSNACMVTQSRLQKADEASLAQPCGCYAERTIASFDRSELQSYRSNGYFNDSGKAKALRALDACNLPHPV